MRIICLVFLGIVFTILIYKQYQQACAFKCEHLIRRSAGGGYKTIADYQGFNVPNIGGFVPSGEPIVMNQTDSTVKIVCQYHAAQTALFTRAQRAEKLNGKYLLPGTVLAQYRHDARISLPGGSVRIGESVWQGLQREMTEELAFVHVENLKYVQSYYNPDMKYCGHLFAEEVSLVELRQHLIRASSISNVGIEEMGYILIPTYNEILDADGFNGFPMFLAASLRRNPILVGNTLQQLIYIFTSYTIPPVLPIEHFQLSVHQACRLMELEICQTDAYDFNNGAHLEDFYA